MLQKYIDQIVEVSKKCRKLKKDLNAVQISFNKWDGLYIQLSVEDFLNHFKTYEIEHLSDGSVRYSTLIRDVRIKASSQA